MDFRISQDNTLMDIINLLRKSGKRNLVFIVHDHGTVLDNPKNRNILFKAGVALKKKISFKTPLKEVYMELSQAGFNVSLEDTPIYKSINILKQESQLPLEYTEIESSKSGYIIITIALIIG